MAEERVKFVAGAKRVNDIDEKKANEIFDLLNKFASYGFNKSHSAAYALISYQTGYLKANYPVQLHGCRPHGELGNSEKVSHFIAEAEAMDRCPRSRRERVAWHLHSRRRQDPFGLAGIKGVGEQAAEKILAEREAHGPYRDYADFLIRSDAPRHQQTRPRKPRCHRRFRF